MSGTRGTGIRQASSFPERHVDGRIGGAGGFENRDKGVGLVGGEAWESAAASGHREARSCDSRD